MNNKKASVMSFYMCERCRKQILEYTDGLLFKGNVYVADPESTGGIVGNNFPQLNLEGTFTIDDVGDTAYHRDCFNKYLDEVIEVAESKRSNKS